MTPFLRAIGFFIIAICTPVTVLASAICDEDSDGVPDEQDVCCGTPIGVDVDETGRPIGDLDGDCDVDLVDYGLMQANFTGPLAPCPPECTDNADCDPDEMCLTANGDCGGVGECAVQPDVCPDIYDPVCGCDGNTYSNACDARKAGVNIDYDGVCVPTCQDNSECAPTDYCAKSIDDCGGTGECQTRTILCFAPIPVCGCDGQTYTSYCDAAAAGQNIVHGGPCLPPPCDSNADCESGNFCSKSDGDCDGTGECLPEPQICAAVFDPVCGCDGQTYSNRCTASAAGVSVASDGPCPEVCRIDSECDPDQLCLKENCQDISGECVGKPDACIQIFSPVCGCDGQTYGNSCIALQAGVNIDHDGPCVPECTTDAECNAAGQGYCKRPLGECAGPGYCQAHPQACPDVFDPVCGCDGQTYSNACEAGVAGVNVQHDGPCATPCVNDNDCVALEYCKKPPSDCESIGECAYSPGLCPQVYDPVCGCDGETYGNECLASVAGANVEHEGECCE